MQPTVLPTIQEVTIQPVVAEPVIIPIPQITMIPESEAEFLTSITIVGNDDCRKKTKDALALLNTKAPVHYTNVTTYISIIECADAGSGMFAWENPPRYKVGAATVNAGTIWYAGTIAHDACHSRQYHVYLSEHPGSLVPNDVFTGKAAEAECLDVQKDALEKIGASQTTIDYVKNIINSEYWNVEYRKRWW